MQKNGHIRTLKIILSTSEFGGLQKRKTQHALVGLGSAAVAAAVALPRKGDLNFPKGIKCVTLKYTLSPIFHVASIP